MHLTADKTDRQIWGSLWLTPQPSTYIYSFVVLPYGCGANVAIKLYIKGFRITDAVWPLLEVLVSLPLLAHSSRRQPPYIWMLLSGIASCPHQEEKGENDEAVLDNLACPV